MYRRVCVACSLASVRLERLTGECLPSVASIRYFLEFIALSSSLNRDWLELQVPCPFLDIPCCVGCRSVAYCSARVFVHCKESEFLGLLSLCFVFLSLNSEDP